MHRYSKLLTTLNAKEIKVRQPIGLLKLLAVTLVLPIVGGIASPSSAGLKQKSQLTVEIKGLKNQQGQVCLSLFASSRGFPSNSSSAIQSQCVASATMPLSITFKNLQPGSYAVAVLHDTNSDKKANRNGLGIPLEGFGFSENPVILTGPPKFNDAAVLVAGSTTNIQIQLNYLLGG
ncbi:DUF2141 domain-containing protein [Scytonema sp. UIC 10036]|uniref:DUF2141 domain-containing protein n=1 Tax=Scytonema sp. UIC 10036 TaxID=2304196 RepID=UPI0012DAF481|nr:DUF2141 domain-containing protein [Scytonema sp. UIC 10036]MUG96726.1 DUF2141 domain-containing protein [Scytonema sp. UIC 10036]